MIAIPLLVVFSLYFYGLKSFENLSFELCFILILSAIALCLGELLFMTALTLIPVSRAAPISSSYPFFSVIFAIFLLDEQPGFLTLLGTLVIVLGIVLIVQAKNNNGMHDPESNGFTLGMGEFLAISAAFFWALALNLTGMIIREPDVEVIPIVAFRLLVLFAMVFGVLIFHEIRNQTLLKKKDIFNRDATFLMIGGIVGWTVAISALFTSLDLVGASIAVPLSSIYPMIAALLGVIILKEKISRSQTSGIFIIIIGCILIVW